MKRLVSAAILACLFAPPARADVTIKVTIKGPIGDTPAVQSIKGTKMRSEVSLQGVPKILIIDTASAQMTILDPQTRQATVYDMSKTAQPAPDGVDAQAQKVSMTANGQTRELLGRTCNGYDLSVSMPGTRVAPNTTATVTLGGPVWIAKDAPGTKDYAAFYKAAADTGLFIAPMTGRGSAANPGPNERAMALMYKALAASGGIPYEQVLEVKATNATGPMADMIQRGGGPPTVTTTVTSVSTDPLPDSLFEIPAGYVKKIQ